MTKSFMSSRVIITFTSTLLITLFFLNASTAEDFEQSTPSKVEVDQVQIYNQKIYVTYFQPDAGSDSIIDFEYSTDNGSTWKSTGGTGLEINIFNESSSDNRLVNGNLYKIRIRAINSVGAGEASEPVDATPVPTVPGVVSFYVEGRNQKILVFLTGVDDGGSPITDIEYSTDRGDSWRQFEDKNNLIIEKPSTYSESDKRLIVNGLTYPVKIRANNSVGTGNYVYGEWGNLYAFPNPTSPKVKINSINAGNKELIINVDIIDDGGFPITNFKYKTEAKEYTAPAVKYPGECWFFPEKIDSTTLIIKLDTNQTCWDYSTKELVNEVEYSVKIKGINEIGEGEPSTEDLATPSNKISQSNLIITNSTIGSAGTSKNLTTSGGSGSGLISFQLVGENPGCNLSGSSLNTDRPVDCKVIATKSSDTQYFEKKSSEKIFTFLPINQLALLINNSNSGIANNPVNLVTSGGSGTGVVSFQLVGENLGCSITGTNLKGSGEKTCKVKATKAATGIYKEVESSPKNIFFNFATQTVSFMSPSGMTPASVNQDLTVSASSGLAVSLTSLTPTICSVVSGPKVSVSSQQKEGTCKIRASQSGDLEYKAATNVDKTFSVLGKCSTYGSVISNYLGKLECRQIINNSGKWVQVEEISLIPEDSNLEAVVDLAECKINDQRSVQTQPWNIAFPFNGWFGLNRVDGDSAPGPGLVGRMKIAIIPVDFSNKIGSGSPKSTIDAVDLLIDDWEQYFTRGNLELEIVSTPDWIRAGKNSTYYNTPHGSYTTSTQLQELINLSDPYIDFKDVKYIYFLFPSGSQVQTYGLAQNIDSSYTTDLGSSVLISHFGFSNYKNDSTKNLTIFGDLMHEWSHPAGFAGHAPGNGSVLWGYTPRTWEAVLAGWLNEINEEAVCVDKNKLNSSGYVFNLAPWDLGNISGTKTIIIKIDNSNLMVIESRRVSKFMPEIFKGFYGLNVYNVDSTKDTDRCDSCNQLTRINNSYSKYIPIQNGKRGNILNTSLNWIVFEGESVVSKGIEIKLQNTGSFDQVEISTN